MILSIWVTDIVSGPKATRRPERKRTGAFGWLTESFYYKGISGGRKAGRDSIPPLWIARLKKKRSTRQRAPPVSSLDSVPVACIGRRNLIVSYVARDVVTGHDVLHLSLVFSNVVT